jgi:polyphenol oxidase
MKKGQRLKSSFLSDSKRIPVILPKIFSNTPDVLSAMSMKLGSDAGSKFGMNMSYKVGDENERIKNNRDKFFSQFGLSERNLAVPLQCHSNRVVKVEAPGEYGDCDALITNVQQVALAVTIADCVPLLLYDPQKRAVGVVHAGWRGTSRFIIQQAVEMMEKEYHTVPTSLLVFIGPSAGVCCYEVGRDVAVMFRKKNVHYEKKRIFLDLKKENMAQLLEKGVLEDHIEVSPYCTICENELFHSYRRDGRRAGRMMAVICIR